MLINKRFEMLDAICIAIAILPRPILIGWFTATIATIETLISDIKELCAYKFLQDNCVVAWADAPSPKYHLKKNS